MSDAAFGILMIVGIIPCGLVMLLCLYAVFRRLFFQIEGFSNRWLAALVVLFLTFLLMLPFLPGDNLKLVVFLAFRVVGVGFIAVFVPLVFIGGWIKSRQHAMGHLMRHWTAAIVLLIVGMVTAEALGKSISPVVYYLVIGGTLLGVFMLGLRGLVPHYRVERRLRALVRDTNEETIGRVTAMGPGVIPELNWLLADNFFPNRMAAVACLCRMGEPAIPSLENLLQDPQPKMAAAAAQALEYLRSQLEPAGV